MGGGGWGVFQNKSSIFTLIKEGWLTLPPNKHLFHRKIWLELTYLVLTSDLIGSSSGSLLQEQRNGRNVFSYIVNYEMNKHMIRPCVNKYDTSLCKQI